MLLVGLAMTKEELEENKEENIMFEKLLKKLDEMEDKGIVGPFMGSKPRSILITKEQWQAMKNGSGSQLAMDEFAADDFSEGVPEELD